LNLLDSYEIVENFGVSFLFLEIENSLYIFSLLDLKKGFISSIFYLLVLSIIDVNELDFVIL